MLEPRSDKNKARQRGCDLGTAGEREKFREDDGRVEGRGRSRGEVVGVEGWGGVGLAVNVLIVSRQSLTNNFNVQQMLLSSS